jgi:hypothetical protein
MDEIIRLLAAMGGTPDEVAATLRAEGVRGLRDSPSVRNPVVRYLNRQLDIGGRLEVGTGGTVLRLFRGGRVQETPLPDAVRDFLAGFHGGRYPDLEKA